MEQTTNSKNFYMQLFGQISQNQLHKSDQIGINEFKHQQNLQHKAVEINIDDQFKQSRPSLIMKNKEKEYKKQSETKPGIKAYNFVNNRAFKPLVDDPRLVNYIISAIKQTINEGNAKENKKTHSKKSKQNSNSKQQDYPKERNFLTKLNEWITIKIKQHKNQQKFTGTLITQRIHSLHLVFSETCRQAGKFSKQIAEVLTNIQEEYHSMYESLTDCFMKQNLSLKKNNQYLEHKMNNIVIRYEEELLNIRLQFDKKSSKVIENFHKCITMKQKYEEECKILTKRLKNEELKLGFMEQGLARSIQILLEIGEEKFKFFSNEEEKAILTLGLNNNSLPENYRIFHKWCSTILKIIANMKQQSMNRKRDKSLKQNKNHSGCSEDDQQHIKYLRKFTLSAIGKFMIDFDSSLSVKEAENLLLNFMSYNHQNDCISQNNHLLNELDDNKLIQPQKNQSISSSNKFQPSIDILEYYQSAKKLKKQVDSKIKIQKSVAQIESPSSKKSKKIPTVPNLHEISQKFRGVDAETQINNLFHCQTKAIQTLVVETTQCAVIARPRQKTKQTSTLVWIREKLKINNIKEMNMYVWGEKQIKQKIMKNNCELNITLIEKENKQRSLRETLNKKNFIYPVFSNSGNSTSRKSSKILEIKKNKETSLIKQKIKLNDQVNHLPLEKKQDKKNDDNDKGEQNVQDQNLQLENKKNNRQAMSKKQVMPVKKVAFRSKKIQKENDHHIETQWVQQHKKIIKIPFEASNKSHNNLIKKNYEHEVNDINVQHGQQKLFGINSYTNKVVLENENICHVDPVNKAMKKKNIVKNHDFQIQFDQESERQQSKSFNFIRHSNEYNFCASKRKIGIFKDLDILVENIITHRKNYVKNDKDYLSKDREKDKSIFQKINKEKVLDIHGRHIDLEANPNINHTQKLQIGNIQNILCKASTNRNTKAQEIMMNLIAPVKKIPQYMEHMQNENKFETQSHNFLIQFIQRVQQKNKKITESSMWNFKKSQQIQKFVHKLHLSKQRIMPNSNNLQIILKCITNYIDPAIRLYVRMYSHLVQYQNVMNLHEYKNNLMTGKKICYYHRLAPLLFILVNSISLSCPNLSKCTKYLTNFYKGIKNLQNIDKDLEIYEQLLEGSTIQLDIFIKIIYYLSEDKSVTRLQNQYALRSVVELQLFFILDAYLSPGQINNLITQIRYQKKQPNTQHNIGEQKICLHNLTVKILKTINFKKNNLIKKYKPILQILGEQGQSVSYNDLVYFMTVFPADRQTRQKIIYQSSFYLIYWDKKQATIPRDRLLFLLESLRLISNQAIQKNLIQEYFKMKCERQYKYLHDKISSNPDYVVQSIYKILYRIPPILYRLTQQVKLNRGNKKNIPILTVLYNTIIEEEIEKIYMPGFLNALSAVPLPF